MGSDIYTNGTDFSYYSSGIANSVTDTAVEVIVRITDKGLQIMQIVGEPDNNVIFVDFVNKCRV